MGEAFLNTCYMFLRTSEVFASLTIERIMEIYTLTFLTNCAKITAFFKMIKLTRSLGKKLVIKKQSYGRVSF